MTFKEFLKEEEKKKKKKDADKKQIADHEVERTHGSYKAANALNAQGMGRGIK
jgi:hypothetical protein